MSIVSWTPFRDMEYLFNRRHNRLSEGGSGDTAVSNMDWRPVADISETDKEYLIKAELPEVNREDVHVEVENGRITISGERSMDKDEKDATQHRIESFYGTFSRSFALPNDVAEDSITARSRNGVLKVHLPKMKVSEPHSVEIAVK